MKYKLFINAAHGRYYEPHEKPPEGEHDDPLSPWLVLLEFVEENADISMSVFLLPHLGQETSSLSLVLKHKYSKILPHFLHLNS